MNLWKIQIMRIAALIALLIVLSSAGLYAGSVTGHGVTPNRATANSLYKFTVTWQDDAGRAPLSVSLNLYDQSYVLNLTTDHDGSDIRQGRQYYVYVSAGLGMALTGAFMPDTRVRYCENLTSYGGGSARTHIYTWEVQPPAEGEEMPTIIRVQGNVTVHDSTSSFYDSDNVLIDRYGGVSTGRDWMYSFPSGYPMSVYPDPLHVTPFSDQFPDEGTSSSTYTFRVVYGHRDGLSPQPWVRYQDEWWNRTSEYESGVMLYIRNLDYENLRNSNERTYWSQFRGHHMYPVGPSSTGDGSQWILRVVPESGGIIRTGDADHWRTTMARTTVSKGMTDSGWYYEALPPGRYEYFFACSDDNFSAWDGDPTIYNKNRIWPQLDDSPAMPMPLPPNDSLSIPQGARQGLNWTGGYVDKTTYMPGAWMSGYPHDSWVGTAGTMRVNMLDQLIESPAFTYPQVDPGMYQIGSYPTGAGRFLGTLTPYKRAVNPQIPAQHTSAWRQWAETAGGTLQDVFTFQVMYWQSQGVPPRYMRLFVNNSWDGTTGNWTSYDMYISPGQSEPLNYKTGVRYEYRLSGGQLGAGPHCYYFEASDDEWDDLRYGESRKVRVGSRICKFPRRPRAVEYDGAVFYDWYLPTPAPGEDQGWQGLPEDNDLINGPYINTRPELVHNSWSVTPTTGSSGTQFLYRVTYRDTDNQRPYTAHLIIEYDDDGSTATVAMERAPDSEVPGNSAKRFDEGVVYQFRVSSADTFRLQPGNRRFRFEFRDDWGRLSVPDDRIAGELIHENQRGWIGGPIVTSNSVPRLTGGSVRSADGTSNDATTWNYRVKYWDQDNTAPAYILVFLGRQDTPNGSIIWDSGHHMAPVDPNDNVYTDGRDYIFSTRLPGDSTNPIKYYHCFVASDGIAVADYHPTNSPSSGMVWNTAADLTLVSGNVYRFAQKPLVVDIPPSSPLHNPTNYTNPVIYVGGASVSGSNYILNPVDGLVNFTDSPASVVTARYWFGTEPDANGPVEVTGNSAPTLLNGQVMPVHGESSTIFTYIVTYKDLDGQAPQYINAVVDGNRIPMIPDHDSTVYKNGVTYRCTATLTSGDHTYYFEASDGGAMAIFDADLSNDTLDPINGPYINDRPVFSNPRVMPSGDISVSQPVTYAITYSDRDNDAPNEGYPVVYIDNPNEESWGGVIDGLDENSLKDSNQNWTPGQFNGMPVEITLAGTLQRIIYKIHYNTSDTLYVVAAGLPDDINIGDSFVIGMLHMQKEDPSALNYSEGVVYEAKVPSLGQGEHTAHFTAIVTETRMPGLQMDYVLRHPETGEIHAPSVSIEVPAGNTPPILSNGGVTPSTGSVSTVFKFSVTYRDADGDSPVDYHDGTVGFIRMVIEESPDVWKTYNLNKTLDAPQYTEGEVFLYMLSGLSLGAHRFYFEASDGWVQTRLPSSGYLNVYVSRPPILTEGSVYPLSGNMGRVFEYKVKYTDPDNNPPAWVKLIVDGGTPIDISVPMPGANYIDGVVYSYPMAKGALEEGAHDFYFIASDGYGHAWFDKEVYDGDVEVKNSQSSIPPTPVEPIPYPTVHSNDPPTLSNGSVSPGIGYDLTQFTYSVRYADPNNDEPEYVELYIDEPDPLNPNSANAIIMTKNPAENDFIVGVTYTAAVDGLAAGVPHRYFFKASDWLAEVTLSEKLGPTVEERAAATITLSAPSTVTLGNYLNLEGYIRGHSNVALAVPLTITIQKPNNAEMTVSVTSDANGRYTYSFEPELTGLWRFRASWPGSAEYQLSVSPEASTTVIGPSRTISGLDMISIPLNLIHIYPDSVFGSDPPFALAKWLPNNGIYKLYSLLPGIESDWDFTGTCPITTGQAYWIKVAAGQSKTISPSGTLVDRTQDYAINLQPGWNQIGSPFSQDVNWNILKVKLPGSSQLYTLTSAATSGWVKDYGWGYDKATGNYKLIHSTLPGALRAMEPWKGYWLKANASCQLVIPGLRSVSDDTLYGTSSKAVDAESTYDVKWQVQMIASIGDLSDEFNFLGASKKALSIESPGCLENYVDLYFMDGKSGMLAMDLRENPSFGDVWECAVITDKSGEVRLTWKDENIPANAKLTLVDVAANKSTPMVSGGSYVFRAVEKEIRKFRVLFETE